MVMDNTPTTNPGTGERFVGVDFAGVGLPGANLAGASFFRCNFTGVNMAGANMEGAYFGNCVLPEVDLSGANLTGARIRNSVCPYIKLAGADLTGLASYRSTLHKAQAPGANLPGACLENVDLAGANLRGANLTGSVLGQCNLFGADLDDAILAPDFSETSSAGLDWLADPNHTGWLGGSQLCARFSECMLEAVTLPESVDMVQVWIGGPRHRTVTLMNHQDRAMVITAGCITEFSVHDFLVRFDGAHGEDWEAEDVEAARVAVIAAARKLAGRVI